jgi:hypothetical protein
MADVEVKVKDLLGMKPAAVGADAADDDDE